MTLLRKMVTAAVLLGLSCVAFANPPEQSGPHVYRYQDNYWFWFIDFDTGLTAFFGVPDIVAACSGPFLPEEVSVMDNVVDEDSLRIVSRVRGDLTVTVWETIGIDCAKFTTEMPLAYGTVTFRVNDNDVLAWQENDRSNKNSYGFKANGPVWSPLTGEQMRLHFVAHFVWGGANNPSFVAKELVNIEVR